MSGGHEGKQVCHRGHPLDPLVGRSEAEDSKRILDPRGVGTPRSGVPTATMCCVKGDNDFKKATETQNFANGKAARPFTSDTIVWLGKHAAFTSK